ncbi:MAG: hypothetical protein SAJ37_18500 [Oscillatoria sp. PMC 1068.18]|nr:hypothetical protein [Oscillatoria sp. PMC 1076.18]MEC4990727.1 hypothetical protein [Oscillatoria sp. PMC 1068.18]
MEFYTVVLRKSTNYWVGLCLENGIVCQGETQAEALSKLQEAIASFDEVYQVESEVYTSSVPLQELHEFLSIGTKELKSESFELRVIYASQYSFTETQKIS